MPISPADAIDLSKALLQLYSEAEEELMAKIAARLANGVDAPDWMERQLRSIREIRSLTSLALQRVTRRGYGQLAEAVLKAYNIGVGVAHRDLTGAKIPRPEIAFGGVDPEAVSAFILSSRGIRDTLQEGGLHIASSAERAYREVVEEVGGRMLTGTVTRREAAAQAVAKWSSRGIGKFTDKRGRNWDIASYAEMATRSAAGQAMVQGHVDRLADAGHDLVMVSDAPEECKLCRPFEGKVLSLGKTAPGRYDGYTVMTTLSDARGRGLFHPNCRHRTVLYVPGRTKPMHDTADPEGDKLRQKQRAYERRVRDLKREAAAVAELGDTEQLRKSRAKLRAKQAEFKTWREANGRKDLAYRTSLTAR